jgi:DNA-binding LacI/PurR family transcriptional regulator
MTGSSFGPYPAPVPQRATLAAQVRDVLREAIRQGTWPENLPGELELSRKLQVSRMTLRAALRMLTREGWVSSSQGRRRRVLRRKTQPLPRESSNRIVFLTAVPVDRMRSLHLLHVDGLREKLALAGFELDVQVSPTCFSSRPDSALEKIDKEHPAAAWVVMNSTVQLQTWFMARRRPCVIVGARHPGITLPSIGTDYHALGRHAAGQFLRRRHRHLAVLLPNEEKAGHTNTVEGFRAACTAVEGAVVRVVRHDGTPAGLRNSLRGLLHGTPATGLLVALPQFTIGAVTALLDLGVRVGREVSLIGRDGDAFLDFVTPTVARYDINVPLFVQKLSRMVLTTARGGGILRNDTFLLPEFVPGDTLGKLSAAS